MARLTNRQRSAIAEQVRAGTPCPLCRKNIKPHEYARVDNNTSRCPHCFRMFEEASKSYGMTNPDVRH